MTATLALVAILALALRLGWVLGRASARLDAQVADCLNPRDEAVCDEADMAETRWDR